MRVGEHKPMCTFDDCIGSLDPMCWKVGQSNSLQSRILHTLHHTVLLVSTVHLCSFGHELCSTDPKFLDQFSQAHIPFVPLHRTGFVKQSTIALTLQGMAFASVEQFIRDRRQEFSMLIVNQLEAAFANINHLFHSQVADMISRPMPSNGVLTKCFVVECFMNKEAYSTHMSLIPIKKYISIDHTFRVASNIGYVRSDGKWFTLYKSLFIAMNENGQVVTWFFTRTTSIDEVALQLKDVKEIRHQSWVPPHTILVDNCCSQRLKLKQIFVDSTIVKIDIFHAIQRIVRKIPKRHPYFYECMSDLKMVFHSPTDIGKL